jgi:glutamate dehydrogenase
VIDVATEYQFDLIKTAKVYYEIGNKFNLVWFRDHIANDVREGYWNNLARLTLRDELDILQKRLTIIILQSNNKEFNVDKLILQWMEEHERPIHNWEKVLQMLHGSMTIDYSMFFIALRELSDWVEADVLVH